MKYGSREDYARDLYDRMEFPLGFQVYTHSFFFNPQERDPPREYRMNLSLLRFKATQRYGYVSTRSSMAGASVVLARERLEIEETTLAALLVNNCIANTLTPHGDEDARRIAGLVAKELEIAESTVLPVSTGIIGWRLPVDAMCEQIPILSNLKQAKAFDFAGAIMTTDRYPKLVCHNFPEGGSILAIAKGAGMIEPRMATMLVFLLTDVAMSKEVLQDVLSEVADKSFNRITIDSDTSTNDMALLISTGLKPAVSTEVFSHALLNLAKKLSDLVVRNGEGVSHVVRYHVSGMPDNASAHALGKLVANSPLVKTAIAGNDPNVGRIVSAIGKYQVSRPIDLRKLSVKMATEQIFRNAAIVTDARKERILKEYLKKTKQDVDKAFPSNDRCVDIFIHCAQGNGEAEVLGSDFTKEYVKINAEYRT